VSERKGQAGNPKPAKAGAKGASKTAAAKPEAVKAAAKPAAAKPAAAKPAPKAPPAAKVAPKAAAVSAEAVAEGVEKSFKRRLIGRVKSDKMNKTVVVEVVRSKMDPVYKKYVRVRKSYQAHDEENTYRIGDRVEIIEHRPLSRMKRWKVINLVARAVQE
jgi:small subunit ribosomal protein S17